MSQVDNPYRNWGTIAANADVSERTSFIRQTYLHLGGAVMTFTAIEAVLLNTPGIEQIVGAMMGGRFSWLIVIGAFMLVSYVADKWARNATSPGMQYAGLGLYVVAEAVIFLPLLYIAGHVNPDIIPIAGTLTLVIFGGLTAIVFMTGADFSFLRVGLSLAALLMFAIFGCSILFGWQLNVVLVCGVMIGIASGYILYDTSNVLHHYRIGQHVAAALALFASVALLFWYIVQLVMSLTSRD